MGSGAVDACRPESLDREGLTMALRSPMQSWKNRVDSVLMRPRRQTSSPGDGYHVHFRWSRPKKPPPRKPLARDVMGHKSPLLDKLLRKERKAAQSSMKQGYELLMESSLQRCRVQQGRLSTARAASRSRIQDMVSSVQYWGPPHLDLPDPGDS